METMQSDALMGKTKQVMLAISEHANPAVFAHLIPRQASHANDCIHYRPISGRQESAHLT